MSLHQRLRIRASRQAAIRQAKEKSAIRVYYKTQNSSELPSEYLSVAECKALKASGAGDFIDRGKAFRRFDKVSPAHDRKQYKQSSRGGESLRIDENMMIRYCAGDDYAVEAVNSWA